MGLGGYILSQSKNWEEIVKAPDSGAVLVCVVGAITFLVAFFGCCGASQESHCMLTIYAVVVGVVFILEVAGAILLLVYTKEVSFE
jgi:CD63 antigen